MTIPSGQREEEIDRRIVKGLDNCRGIVNQHIEKGIVIVNQNYKRRLSWSAEKKQGMQLTLTSTLSCTFPIEEGRGVEEFSPQSILLET